MTHMANKDKLETFSPLSSTSSLNIENFSFSAPCKGLNVKDVVPLSKACSGLLRHHLEEFSSLDTEGEVALSTFPSFS